MAVFGAYLIALAVALLCKKKIEETVAPAVIGIVLTVYLFGKMNILGAGVIAVYVLFAAALVYIVYKLITDRGSFAVSIFTWGAAALVFYSLFFAYYSFHRDFSHPDELYCWGLLAKNYYRYGEFHSYYSTALGREQTPFMPTLFYLASKLWVSFSDSICYLNHNILVISLVLPVFAHFRGKLDTMRTMMVALILPSMLVLSGMEGFHYALGDIVLAAGMCFALMNAIAHTESGDRFYYVVGLLNMAAMCLVKRAGVLFVALMIVCVVSLYMRSRRKGVYYLVGYALVGLITEFSWFGFDKNCILPVLGLLGGLVLHMIAHGLGQLNLESYIRELIIAAVIMGVLGIMGVFTLKFLCTDAYGYSVVARNLGELFTVSVDEGFIKLAYGLFILILLAVIYLIKSDFGALHIDGGSREMYVKICTNTIICMVMYYFFMLYIHITQTGPMNEWKERIVPRYLIPWEILAAFLVIYIFVVRNSNLTPLMLIITYIVIVLISDTGTLYSGMFAKHRCIGYTALQDAGVEVKLWDMVYFIDEQNYFSYTDREFYYSIFPGRSNFIDQIFNGNNGRVEMTAEELAQDMADDRYLHVPYVYLYLQSYDDDFAERYGELFEDVNDIAPGSAYRINVDDGGVTLSLLGKQR